MGRSQVLLDSRRRARDTGRGELNALPARFGRADLGAGRLAGPIVMYAQLDSGRGWAALEPETIIRTRWRTMPWGRRRGDPGPRCRDPELPARHRPRRSRPSSGEWNAGREGREIPKEFS